MQTTEAVHLFRAGGTPSRGCAPAPLVPAASAQEIRDASDLATYCRHHPADAESDLPTALSLVLCIPTLTAPCLPSPKSYRN